MKRTIVVNSKEKSVKVVKNAPPKTEQWVISLNRAHAEVMNVFRNTVPNKVYGPLNTAKTAIEDAIYEIKAMK